VKRRKERFTRFASPMIWPSIAPELDWNARLRKGLLWVLALAFVMIALARPQMGSHAETAHVSGLDIMVALDVSNSMEVEDVVPSRLKKAKHLIRSLIDRLGGDRVGLVAFAGSSYVASPLTTDLDYVLETIEVLTPRSVTNQGTDIGIALETAARALDRGAEELTGSNANSRAVLLISDGEDHEGKGAEGAKKLKEAGINLFVMGVGTEAGGPIPVRDDEGQLHGYKRDVRGQSIVSSFKPDDLKKIADTAGGKYWMVTANENEIRDLLDALGLMSRSDYAEKTFMVYEERYQWPLAIAILLLILELCIPARRILPKAGAALLLALGLSAAGTGIPEARADGLRTYLENEKGVEALQKGKLDEAKKSLGTAQALDPSSPEIQFNEGLLQMQEGDSDSAVSSFDGAAQEAAKRGNSDLSGKAYFNRAGALSKKGDLDGAIQSYLSSIEMAQKAKNARLEDDARKNIELLFKEQQKQKQQQNQDQKKKQDQKQDQQQQQQQQQAQNDQDQKKQQQQQRQQGQQQQQEKQYQQNKKQEFRSLKMSKEDAERVMAELSGREKELQGRLKKQRGQPSSTDKDW
jgi:Ca-activated chloride channel family protein